MTRFVVLEPAGRLGPSERARLVPDRFRWAALPLPALWLAANRAVLPALGALALDAALVSLWFHDGLGESAVWLAVFFRLATALEGPRLVAHSWRRRGWREADIVHAANRETADRVYFASGPIAVSEGSTEEDAAGQGADAPLGQAPDLWWHRDPQPGHSPDPAPSSNTEHRP